MIIPVNMTQQIIDYIVGATDMKKVSKMKHLGVIIKSNGEVTYEDNMLSIETTIRQNKLGLSWAKLSLIRVGVLPGQ